VLIAETILLICLLYMVCGLVIGIPFVIRGVERIDPAACGTSIAFRLLILPGSIALWPVIATKWWKAAKRGHP
jgi:hypothetical protein